MWHRFPSKVRIHRLEVCIVAIGYYRQRFVSFRAVRAERLASVALDGEGLTDKQTTAVNDQTGK